MAGDAESGVTIHRTTAELDAGPIAAQRAFPISGEDAGAVYAKAGAVAAELLENVLAAPEFRPQPEENDLRGTLDRGRPGARLGPTALELLNRIRALSPHIGARGIVEGRQLTVWRAAPAEPESKLTAGGLELLEVQAEGKRRMTGEEYRHGLR